MFFQLDYTRSAVRTVLDLQSAETDTLGGGIACTCASGSFKTSLQSVENGFIACTCSFAIRL